MSTSTSPPRTSTVGRGVQARDAGVRAPVRAQLGARQLVRRAVAGREVLRQGQAVVVDPVERAVARQRRGPAVARPRARERQRARGHLQHPVARAQVARVARRQPPHPAVHQRRTRRPRDRRPSAAEPCISQPAVGDLPHVLQQERRAGAATRPWCPPAAATRWMRPEASWSYAVTCSVQQRGPGPGRSRPRSPTAPPAPARRCAAARARRPTPARGRGCAPGGCPCRTPRAA